MEELRLITRHSEPSHLDTAEFRVLCKKINGYDKPVDYYIQMSPDADLPQWQLLGTSISDETLLKVIDLLK